MIEENYAVDYIEALESAHDSGRHGDDESYYWRANGCRHCYASRTVTENF